MNQERLLRIIKAPHLSEKANIASTERNEYIFKVLANANKYEVKKAVELLFKKKVTSVRTVSIKGKTRRFGGIEGKRKSFKKAYVTLENGQSIDFSSAEK